MPSFSKMAESTDSFRKSLQLWLKKFALFTKGWLFFERTMKIVNLGRYVTNYFGSKITGCLFVYLFYAIQVEQNSCKLQVRYSHQRPVYCLRFKLQFWLWDVKNRCFLPRRPCLCLHKRFCLDLIKNKLVVFCWKLVFVLCKTLDFPLENRLDCWNFQNNCLLLPTLNASEKSFR